MLMSQPYPVVVPTLHGRAPVYGLTSQAMLPPLALE